MDCENVAAALWEVINGTEVVVVEGQRREVEVTGRSIEDDVDGSADILNNVRLNVDNVEVVVELVVYLV